MEELKDPMDSRWAEVCKKDVQTMIGSANKEQESYEVDSAKVVGGVVLSAAGEVDIPEVITHVTPPNRAHLPA